MSRAARSQSALAGLLIFWCVLVGLTLVVALPHIEDTGLYYDEAFLAQQARDFVEPDRAGVHAASVRTAYIAGRPFPIRNAAYLGSLKSQLLIPFLASFGSSTWVLRVSTLVTSLVALLFAMLWVQRLVDTPTACVMGWLVACDPSFFFFSQFEWGPFTTLFLCRSLGFFLLGVGFSRRGKGRYWAFVSGGAVLGLGIYSRADFALVLAAGAVAVMLCRRDWIRDALARPRGAVLAGAAALMIAASPMLVVLAEVVVAGAGMQDRGDIGYRFDVMRSALDGSHFYRVMRSGGLFEQLFVDPAPITGFLFVLAIALVSMIAARRSSQESRAHAFVVMLLVTLATLMVLLPGAVRAHHMLNVLPLPQLVVACAGVLIWLRPWKSPALRGVARGCVAACLAALSISNFLVIRETQSLMEETGGRGRFAKVLSDFAAEVDATPSAPGTTIVSLDWGLHENLLFLTDNVSLYEPIWASEAAARSGNTSVIAGSRDSVYLVHEGSWSLVGMGPAFLAALERIDPKHYERSVYKNRDDEEVFSAVRILSQHHLRYRGVMAIVLD